MQGWGPGEEGRGRPASQSASPEDEGPPQKKPKRVSSGSAIPLAHIPQVPNSSFSHKHRAA